ncbi:MAG: hypothetical protein WAP20_00765 [Limnochordia bacterium]|nr:hypothetical protein [Bacillota bacterium]HOB07995.1 hypothetical protein [Limnochordia bacterium]NLH31601.1 hypothetical protein [Bacillota bacterium]HPT92161.1 hypothetical protein [Limnochordia bacterium]HPZ29852.1 hypothetical protein [Limnochordia bacterium]
MSAVDWTLIIGYPLEEAIEYLREEEQPYRVVVTAPPNKRETTSDDESELRIIAVRSADGCLDLICAVGDWSVA